MFDDPVFFSCRNILSANKQILNKVSKNYLLQISRPGEGAGEVFHIRFSCKRSKRYVEFGI